MSANAQGLIHTPFVWYPSNSMEAWELKQSLGASGIFTAGGTLLRTQWESGASLMPDHLIHVGGLKELEGISLTGDKDGCSIGALTTLSACRHSHVLEMNYPALTEAMRVIAAPSIRNQATLGGNVLSMVGDSLPALLLYDAELYWHDGQTGLQEALSEWLATAAIHPAWRSRVLLKVQLPLAEQENAVPLESNIKRFVAFHKVGRREAFTPSVVTVAWHAELDAQGNYADVRIAVGGGQTIPRRMEEAEKLLIGSSASVDQIQELQQCVVELFEPIGDAFASVEYRKQTAANLLASELWKIAREVG